jgi:hypothetical protein
MSKLSGEEKRTNGRDITVAVTAGAGIIRTDMAVSAATALKEPPTSCRRMWYVYIQKIRFGTLHG